MCLERKTVAQIFWPNSTDLHEPSSWYHHVYQKSYLPQLDHFSYAQNCYLTIKVTT
ncbi:hypothetical protein MTR_7g024495 [Medicago truncatula]|uniref:Uncharacterized protein n=1 Tax=Medicago truncatula TaxID=3880 RepID=A0A072TWQ3_MEDTR|nr:hypothetical protein MTR_7g024495 [Medicago truncatula]